ncbi:hypothetical protein P8A22_12475 [Streptomyces laculatispora]|uniref:Uncharacterized protein n=1 Tax=Streptomyces laculatispora TaxID=887464 RepID=A0ABY9I1J7_9ACTN|nr:hypothetical protein [Streptomyces laculatispora]WLQ40725.1 hypothetical protein P8A22_12475 [Streptomyces laculatispora]
MLNASVLAEWTPNFLRMVMSPGLPGSAGSAPPGCGGVMGTEAAHSVELAVHPQGELGSLRTWLTLALPPGVEVRRTPGTPGPGEQGAFDVLSVLAASTGLVTVIKILPQYLRAKRSDISVTVSVRGKKVTVDATNVEEVMPILERLLDD